MTKRDAREVALHLLFEKEFNKTNDVKIELEKRFNGVAFLNTDEHFEFYGNKIPEVLQLYIKQVVLGVCENVSELDEIISKYSEDWDISRISKLNLSILRIAIFEIKYCDDIPMSASINEAVEISKIYDAEEKSSKFINGILGTFARSLDE